MSRRIAVTALVCAALSGLALAVGAASSDTSSATNIFVVNADGTGRRSLTAGSSPAHRVLRALSPDGRQLAYDRLRVEGDQSWWSIEAIPTRGGAARTLVRLPEASAYAPAWSRDGRLVAFEMCCGPHAIGIVRPDGTDLSLIPDGSEPAWIPGNRVAFLAGGDLKTEIATAKPDGSQRTSVLGAKPFEEFGGLTPSPNGQKFAFISFSDDGARLFTVGPLVQISEDAREASWSPSSHRLAFATRRGLVTARSDGSRRLRYRATRFLNPLAPAWSPDGTRIAFVAGGSDNLIVLNLRHRSLRVVARGVVGKKLLWSQNGRRLYYAALR